ncbi:hypothetical protein C8J55DRAFT_416731 [Lentinula edodes]|uniref:Uncharacterized protein n=1 Tax=Lentinula lateritia TaxID=40482 RepID=A0A9W9B114_9AGAR|nr:hypothetical protein C8J55DRAFT_416731 [Lentinula edodes]
MPGHPNEDQVNHILKEVVDELLLLWHGVFYTHTAECPQGRSVSLAVLPAVCDAEGAHSLSGFASHEHTYFCVRCLLPKNDIHNLKPETWPRRDLEEHRKVASLWRDAPSIADRDKIFKDYGVRWSELLRLPYWNPITFTLIDSMHMGYLGLFSTHIRKIWKMDAEKPKSVGPDGVPSIPPLTYEGVVIDDGHEEDEASQASDSDMVLIWEDSKNTVLPSWIDAPPHNWGTKAAGKLSADEWKVVCSISLVITLIRVWGYKYQHDPQSRHYQLLLNFLDMVHAIQLLNLHETSSQIRQDYHSLILKYLRTVLILFPDVSLKPNHHYAIHIAEDLELMGPVHAHNTPVFERTNHTLQELNSNQHLGKCCVDEDKD